MPFKLLSMKSVAETLNNRTYTSYYNRLKLIAGVRYEWIGLPNNIQERWIEKYLYYYGSCVFFKDENMGLMVAKVQNSGQLNNYDEHTRVIPFGTNYKKGKSLKVDEECIVIRNNDDSIPTMPDIELFAFRLSNCTRTADVNIHAQKTPKVVLCNEKQKLSFKLMMKQVDDFETAVYGSKDLDLNGIETLDITSPIVFDKMELEKHAIWNEAMTFLGINNANQDKRERLVDDEVQANNEQVEYNAKIGLKSRQDAAKQINKLFGTNIRVRMRKLDSELLSEPQSDDKKEGVTNG